MMLIINVAPAGKFAASAESIGLTNEAGELLATLRVDDPRLVPIVDRLRNAMARLDAVTPKGRA